MGEKLWRISIHTHSFHVWLTRCERMICKMSKNQNASMLFYFIFIPFHEFVHILFITYFRFLRMIPKSFNLERWTLFYIIFSAYIYKLILFIISHLLSNQTLSKYPLVLHVRLSSIKNFHHMIQTCILNKFQINIPRESRISSLPPLSLS